MLLKFLDKLSHVDFLEMGNTLLILVDEHNFLLKKKTK